MTGPAENRLINTLCNNGVSILKVFIRTLGCEKNTVDSEYAAGLLAKSGDVLTDDPEEADALIVNTCGFIEDAKKESIDAIFELAGVKNGAQKLYVTGCLAQRYGKELSDEMPEVDGFLGVNDYMKLPEILHKDDDSRTVLQSSEGKTFEEFGQRLRSETPWTAPIKIAEGCNNICTYCAIPFMRGKYRSRKPEDIVKEAESLAAQGCKELVVIAQDVTAYGCDFGKGELLPDLLRRLCAIDGIEWIRLMYCYEDEITQGLIDVINEQPKICKYLDIPIQHCSNKVLKAMNRKSTSESIRSTVDNLRKQIPGIVIRTTLISGFPGETKEDAQELLDFVKETGFERLGVFAYSKEEGTAAARMKNQVRRDVKERRRDRIMAAQREISLMHNQALVGRIFRVLVEEDCQDGTFIGRTIMDAPEIDNGVIFTSEKTLKPGIFVNVKINDAFDYDLSGVCVEEE